MSTYKAVQVTEPGKLQLVELPIREPGRGQVRLQVIIPCILLELLGMAFTTVPAYQNKGGGHLLAEVVQPLDGFATFLLVLLALSVVANNIPRACL